MVTSTDGIVLSLHNCRLDASTMFKVRDWERFQFLVDYEHLQVLIHESLGLFINMFTRHSLVLIHKVPFELCGAAQENIREDTA